MNNSYCPKIILTLLVVSAMTFGVRADKQYKLESKILTAVRGSESEQAFPQVPMQIEEAVLAKFVASKHVELLSAPTIMTSEGERSPTEDDKIHSISRTAGRRTFHS